MNEKTRKEVAFEKKMDPFMEKYYKAKGCKVYKHGDTKQDVVLSYKGEKFSVEHKYRKVMYNDILVEILQDMVSFYERPKRARGWLYECEADLLHYIICQPFEEIEQPIYFHKIEFKLFRKWLFEWLEDNRVNFSTAVGGWGITLNLTVLLSVIPNDMITKNIIIKGKND